MERTAVFADGAGSPAGDAAFEMAVSGPRTDPLVVRLSRNLDRELFLMKEILGWEEDERIYGELREAIGGRCALKMLAAVPFTVFSTICALRRYCPFSAASESCPHPADPSGVPGLDAQENCRRFFEKLRRRFGSSVDRRPDRPAIRISG